MRYIFALLSLLLLPSCALQEGLERADRAYLVYTFDPSNRRVVRKFDVLQNVEGSSVRFQGTIGDVLFSADAGSYIVREITESPNGAYMVLSTDRGIGLNGERAVRIYDTNRFSERLEVNETGILRDSVLTCDVDALNAARVAQELRGIGQPLGPGDTLSFAPGSIRDDPVDFQPLGWVDASRFAIRISPNYQVTVNRSAGTGARLVLRNATPVSLIYNVASGLPTCSDQAPSVLENRAPRYVSQIVRDEERRQFAVIDGDILFNLQTGDIPVERYRIIGRTAARLFGPYAR